MGLFAQLLDMKWLLASIAFLIYAGSKYRTYSRLKHFKGPFSTGFSELWHSRVILECKSHLVYDQVCEKYGKLNRRM
jgi:hypothetical protein